MEQREHIGLDRPCTTEGCDSPSRRTFLLGGAIFISSSLRNFVRAAIDRLIPKDALGPGAVDAGVDVFIDAQLAGPFGQATGIYMQPPFRLGDAEQGYQLPFTPAQVYRLGIQRVDEYCRKNLGNVFAQLKPDQQDKVLHDLEDGKLDLGEIQPGDFFGLLWQNTKEGFLADPIYGGNRDFAGWKLIGYNGPRYNYLEDVDQFGKPYDAPYVSLGGSNPVMCRFSDSPTGRFRGPGCEYAQMPAKMHYDALTTTTGKVWLAGNL